ncbi:hypothetical protein J2S19_001583 [Metabacillus malikii]|uniref:30S ribosomal protein S14 n=1 Tax=Metabacillus malikii TaxID=1504265 RepID=A0ABT9ZEH0_9BACI|nr:hypothetical protein [Metabacillus malikii]
MKTKIKKAERRNVLHRVYEDQNKKSRAEKCSSSGI